MWWLWALLKVGAGYLAIGLVILVAALAVAGRSRLALCLHIVIAWPLWAMGAAIDHLTLDRLD